MSQIKRKGMPSAKTTGGSPAVEPLRLRSRPTAGLAALLLFLFAGLSFWEMAGDSVTIDERVYLPAGYYYWHTGDFSLNPEHPPLVKLLASAPLLLMHLKMPGAAFGREATNVQDAQTAADRQMNFGSRFLYEQDADRLIFWGRVPMVLVGLVLAFFIFRWSSELTRNAGAGLLSLFLVAFEPTLLAHSHYVTTDVALACFSVMSFYFLWRFTESGKLCDFVFASVGLGLSLAAKFSAVFFAPVFIGLLLFYRPDRPIGTAGRWGTAKGFTNRFLAALGSLVIAGVVVQACYLFSPDLTLYWKGLHKVNTAEFAQSILPYIGGRFIPGGAWWYHAIAWFLKLPLPTILAIVAAAVPSRKRWPTAGAMFALLPAAVFALAICALANNLGVRYMIPATAFLLVLAGRSWFFFVTNKTTRLVGTVLAVWLAVSVLRVSPHYISYFNEIVGGPENGPYYLDDSNVDWGQDLKRLARYLRDNGIREVVLAYWGPTPAEYYLAPYGIRYKPWTYEMAGSVHPPAGFYALSVNQLIGIKREQLWLNQPANPAMDWLRRFKPIARVGFSIYIYRFPMTAPAP
ncbi:MAG: ArnT family glycosyltransferase [Alphaproteobacteria bacterium]